MSIPIPHRLLNLWFLEHCHQQKRQKKDEAIEDVDRINKLIPSLFSSIKNHPVYVDVRFNRQGKFRYWFKELHRVLFDSKNRISIEKLCSKALSYTDSQMEILGTKFSGALKMRSNCTNHLIGTLTAKSFKIFLNPTKSEDNTEISINDSSLTQACDFSWSNSCQSSVNSISHRNNINTINILADKISFSTRSSTSLCCIHSCSSNSHLIITSGKDLCFWDQRVEYPVEIYINPAKSSCSSSTSLSKSCCISEINEHLVALSLAKGCINLLDRRYLKTKVLSVNSIYNSIHSIQPSPTKTSLYVQSSNGRIQVLSLPNLESQEYGFSGSGQCYPVNSVSFTDNHFFQCSDKVFLYCESLRLPVLSCQTGLKNTILSTLLLSKDNNLLLSSKSGAAILKLY